MRFAKAHAYGNDFLYVHQSLVSGVAQAELALQRLQVGEAAAAQVAVEISPGARNMTEILRFSVSPQQPRPEADEPCIPLRNFSKRSLGLCVPWRIVFTTQDQTMTIGRNDPCPCGSGKKFKRCCAAQEAVPTVGLGAALRMKGGVAFDYSASAYRAIVHSWDNAECIGEPQQWESSETFSTEEAAMTYYKIRIRPELTRLMSDAAQKEKGGTFLHRRLE